MYVPRSSHVHQTVGKIFDRNEDGDFDITDNSSSVRNLHLRKQLYYSENQIFPYLKYSDLNEELIQRSRTLAGNHQPGHPWMRIDNEQLLRSAGLYTIDYQTGKEGYTLAAALLLGKDEVIKRILPHYKTDLVFRQKNMDRYDDREIITTNLIDSYDLIMSFVRKHLPSKFFMEEGQNINLRDTIFREIATNLLVHREFLNAFPAKFIVEKNIVHTENWCRSNGVGIINPKLFSPFPKNPVITAFFRQIGKAEELGSGLRNITKYIQHYVNAGTVEFHEGDIFKMILNTVAVNDAHDAVNDIVNDAVNDDAVKKRLTEEIRNIIKNGQLRLPEIIELHNIKRAQAQRDIKILKNAGLIIFKGPAKTGAYYLTDGFKKQIDSKD